MNFTSVNGHEIPTDGGDMPCLTAMWTIMGKPPTKSVSRYKQLARFKRAAKFFTCYSKRGGKNPGTWASLMIALDYADYLGLTKAQPKDEPEPPNEPSLGPDRASDDAEQEAWMRAMDEMDRARSERDAAARIRGDEIIAGLRDSFRHLIDSLDEGEDWKKGTIYDQWPVNRCASYTMGLDDLDHLFFDSLDFQSITIRASVN